MTASLADTLVPVCVHAYRYATVFFTVNGPFSERSPFGEFLLSGRCAFISVTYGILNSHFIYRFLSLKHHHFITEYFNPYGLILSVLLVVVHWTLWVVVADITMVADLESRNYVKESFEKVYGSLDGLNMKTVIFSEVSSQVVYRSWFGTLFVTALASYSITLYFVLGYKIMSRMSSLNQGLDYMSDRTLQMQRRLFWALAIQTAIPICVSFMPCILCVHAYRYATIFFLVGGPFSERSRFGEFLLAGRCAFISGTYGILNTHFFYRFLSLRYTDFVTNYFNPYGLILSVLLVVLHWTLWAVVADYTMAADSESRNYVRESFEKVYGKLDHLNIKTVIFSEVPSEVVYRSWVGTLFVTFLASYSLILYFVLGYKIMAHLKQGISYMSPKTILMQKRLFWALFVQTVIPICVSFMPCTLVLYGSAIRIDFMSWVNWMSSIAVSFFPFLDPLAITLCLPALRRRLFARFGVVLPPTSSINVHSVPRV
ncbi:unnamed protein product [Caenorhabditis nigoni]